MDDVCWRNVDGGIRFSRYKMGVIRWVTSETWLTGETGKRLKIRRDDVPCGSRVTSAQSINCTAENGLGDLARPVFKGNNNLRFFFLLLLFSFFFFRFCFSRSGRICFAVSEGASVRLEKRVKRRRKEEGSSERLLNVNCFRLSLMELVSSPL